MSSKTIFFLLLLGFIINSCDRKNQPQNSLWADYFQKIEAHKYSDFDSLVALYHEVEPLEGGKNVAEFSFLKNYLQSIMYFRQGNHKIALEKIDFAMKSVTGISKNDTLIALLYNVKGVNYMTQSHYDSAIINFQQSSEIYQKLNQTKNLQKVHVNLAQLYYDKGDNKKSIIIIDSILRHPLDKKYEMKANHIKANLLGGSGQIDSAIALDFRVLRNIDMAESEAYKSMFYNNLALCYLEKKQIDSALYYCKTSLAMDKQLGHEMDIAANYVLIADIYHLLQEWDSSTYYYQKSITIFSKNQNLDKKLALYKQLKQVYQQRGELQKIIDYQDSIQELEPKINGLELNRNIELLNIEFETARKNQQLENQQLKLKNQQLILIGLIVLVLLLIPFGLLYSRMKSRQSEVGLLRQAQRFSMIADQAEQNERKRIAAELHDSVGQKLAVAKMRLSMVVDEKETSQANLIQLIDETIGEVRDISHNLIPPSLENGLIPGIQKLIDQLNYAQKRSKIEFETAVKTSELKLQPAVSLFLYRIIQEALNNALKHAEAEHINIRMIITKPKISIEIRDDGKGFNPEEIPGFSGIGLRNLLQRVEQMQGKVQIESAHEKGTIIHVSIQIDHE